MNPVRRYLLGLTGIGAVTWLFYLAYIYFMGLWTTFGHTTVELMGIPVTWVFNYGLNTSLNFKQPFSARRFLSFCAISGIGWVAFIITTVVVVDHLGYSLWWGLFFGVGMKTSFNGLFQQAITFRWFGKKEQPQVSGVTPEYDWLAFWSGNPIQRWWKRSITSQVLEMVQDANPVVDLGCGTSPTLSLMEGIDKLGIDIIQGKIELMGHLDPSSNYQQGDVCMTGLPSNHFSVVTSLEVIEHLTEPHLLVREATRIARPGGIVVIATPDFSTPLWNVVEVAYGLLLRKGYHGEHGTKFTKSSLIALANAYGLEHVETRSVLGADLIIKFRKEG